MVVKVLLLQQPNVFNLKCLFNLDSLEPLWITDMTKKFLKLTRLVHNSLALLNLIMNHVSYNGNELL